MKKNIILFVLLLGLSAFLFPANQFIYTNSLENKITFNHSPEFYEVEDGYTRLAKFGIGHDTDIGKPELPHFTTYFQIDPKKDYKFELEIIDSYIIENINVLPHQGIADNWDVEKIEIIDQSIYNSSKFYPENNLIVSERSQGRGIEFVSIQITPYSFYPQDNTLEVYTSVNINIIESSSNLNNSLKQTKRSKIFDQLYQDMIINFQHSDRPEDYQSSAILYIGGGSSLNNSYVQELIRWRHKQGYIVYAASESEVGGSNASTSEIKNYIRNAYDTWENPPEIVGLIGDTGGSYDLPNFEQSWGGYNGPTDYEYVLLDGNDLIPELFIGRISASSSSDLDNIISKTLQYEKATYMEDRLFRNAALAGDPDESGNSTIFTNQYIENIMINHGMNGVQHDYDGSGVQTFMENQFNRGVLYYNYRGWYGGYGSYPTNSIDNGFDTPFVTTLTCGTGDYNGTSPSEEFVRLGSVNNPKGAVAAVGMATIGTHTAYNNIVNMGIYDGIFSKKLWYAGAVEAQGDIAIASTYSNPSSAEDAAEAFSKWSNLIGDPALHLWTATPTDFQVSFSESIPLGTTAQEFTIMDENGNLVENARVTLLMGDDIIFSSGITDENGNVTLSWDDVSSGTMDLTVIKQNFRPYEGTIEIVSIAGPAVAIKHQDHYLNAGEQDELLIELHNYGREVAEDLSIEFSSESDHLIISNYNFKIDEILSNSNVFINLDLYIHEVAYHLEEMLINVEISDSNGNSWYNVLSVNVLGAYLVMDDYYGEIYPGSTTDLILDVINKGSSKSSKLEVELLDNDFIFLNSSILMMDELFVNQNMYLDGFNISFNSDIINGSVVPIEFVLTGSDGYSRNHSINVTVGQVSEGDPLGPDAFGYYIYDSNDIEYEEAPIYDWFEISEGLGEQLSIDDEGNGNSYYTSSTIGRTLPFQFNFYGEEYNKVQINTNGWISFGDFQMNAFRNYSIPGAGGPSPMVAAFWDDLMTGSGGYVYYYESEEFVVVQWENMRTCGDLTGGWYASNCSGGPRQTFQIILYSNNEIKIQYKDFNNSSDGYYPNGGTPSHGCFSTVGIENHLGNIGLEYTFNNSYSEAANEIQDGTALFITNGSSDFILGDINSDGILDILDVVILVNSVLNGDYSEFGDMNEDNVLDVLDIVNLVNAILT